MPTNQAQQPCQARGIRNGACVNTPAHLACLADSTARQTALPCSSPTAGLRCCAHCLQLCDGASPAEQQAWHLLPAKEFHYLNQSSCYNLPRVSNAEEYTVSVMLISGHRLPPWGVLPAVQYMLPARQGQSCAAPNDHSWPQCLLSCHTLRPCRPPFCPHHPAAMGDVNLLRFPAVLQCRGNPWPLLTDPSCGRMRPDRTSVPAV